jgi:BTB/POZ domain
MMLKRMLYGNFREANTSRICLEDYDSVILEAIVEYCYRNEISKFRLYIHRTAASARRLVQLYKAADYLALMGLAKLVAQMAHNLTTRYPPLACAVYDEADMSTKVSRDALEMIQSRPYVTLPPDSNTEGGIGCLSSHKLISIYRDTGVQAGELFLFQMLQEWKHSMEEESGNHQCRGADVAEGGDGENDCILSTVQVCATYLVLQNIEPQDLLTLVSPSGFCKPESITQAITKQALRASHTRVWTLSSRGPDIERILVEGAGSKDANGIYYRIDGLANGELYSKREISCGQEFVYTLSISLKNASNDRTLPSHEQVECRIFCSKILTHKATSRLARKVDNGRSGSDGNNPRHLDGDISFQPILQVIFLEDLPSEVESTGMVKQQVSAISDLVGGMSLLLRLDPLLPSISNFLTENITFMR